MSRLPVARLREIAQENARKREAAELAAQTPRTLVVDAEAVQRRNQISATLLSHYEFLVSMYLPASALKRPPEDGWPWINAERFAFLGKTDVVIDLLKHIPYIADGSPENKIDRKAVCFDYTGHNFLNEFYISQSDEIHPPQMYEHRDNKPTWCPLDQPQHLALLARPSEVDGPYILIDTRDGKIGCVHERNHEDAVSTFEFDSLKQLLEEKTEALRTLADDVPVGPDTLITAVNTDIPEEVVDRVKDLYRKYGWPSATFDKGACMAEVSQVWEAWYRSRKGES